jgi:hypothetical protein
MHGDPRHTPRRPGEPERPGAEHRRFLGLELWQQVIAGLAVAAIVAIVGHLLISPRHPAPTPGQSGGSTPMALL